MSSKSKYSIDFYNWLGKRSYNSASIILKFLFEHYKPNSIVDFGCGAGSWLKSALELGTKEALGLDGSWISPKSLMDPRIIFKPIDFEKPTKLEKIFDLSMSLEVAEHVSISNASNFVRSLCSAAPVVLFSAATKEQGGRHHINEQYPSYWVGLFNNYDYECFDIIRPVLWDNREIDWWYRQNIFLFVSKNNSELLSLFKSIQTIPILNSIHPENYEMKCNRIRNTYETPTIRTVLSVAYRWIKKWTK